MLVGLWASLNLSFLNGGENTCPAHMAIWSVSRIRGLKMLYKP